MVYITKGKYYEKHPLHIKSMKKKLLTFFATHRRTFNSAKVILWIFSMLFWYIGFFLLPLDSAHDNLILLIALFWFAGMLALPLYILPKLNDFINIKINEVKQKMREDFLGSVDITDICMEMLEAVQQKHRHINYDTKLENYSDWMAFQVKNGNYRMLSDVAEGMNPSELDETIKNSDLGNQFKGQRGAYDTFTQEEKDSARSVIVTFDNALIYKTKFLDWLLNHNWLIRNLVRPAVFTEINLLSQINLMTNVFDHLEIRVKFSSKAMSYRGSEVAEIQFTLDKEDKPSFRELVMMHAPIFSFTEKEMKDSDTVEVIQFMQKFIKNTRKLIH